MPAEGSGEKAEEDPFYPFHFMNERVFDTAKGRFPMHQIDMLLHQAEKRRHDFIHIAERLIAFPTPTASKKYGRSPKVGTAFKRNGLLGRYGMCIRETRM